MDDERSAEQTRRLGKEETPPTRRGEGEEGRVGMNMMSAWRILRAYSFLLYLSSSLSSTSLLPSSSLTPLPPLPLPSFTSVPDGRASWAPQRGPLQT